MRAAERTWVVVDDPAYRKNPRVLEARSDGTHWEWSYSVFGAYALGGTLLPEVRVRPARTRRERDAVLHEIEMVEQNTIRMVHHATLCPDGTVHVQNYLGHMTGQHHVHDATGFAVWAKDVSEAAIERSEGTCDCGLRPGEMR